MKWKIEGHEFDEIGKKFECIDKIYIYGAGEFGTNVATILKKLGANITFVDRKKANQKRYMDCDIISPTQLYTKQPHSMVILSMGHGNAEIVLKHLEVKGYRYGENVFDYYSFMNFYLYLFSLYRYKKCILKDCSVMATFSCSLKCRNCMEAIPYIKNPPQVEPASFFHDVDILFANVDYILEFGISGGEMLLSKHLGDYIQYVMDNYGQKIGNCSFLTNGTILPNETIIRLLKKYHMHVDVSNYSTVDGWNEKFENLKSLMSKNNIPVKLINYKSWVDMGWKEKKYKKEVNDLFDACGMQCRVARNGKLFYCIHGMTANEALFHLDMSEDEFDLSIQSDRKKFQLVEYNLGFNKRGNLEICHYCNGYININENIVAVAEQIK